MIGGKSIIQKKLSPQFANIIKSERQSNKYKRYSHFGGNFAQTLYLDIINPEVQNNLNNT